MKADDPRERSEKIKQAAVQYAFNRWRSGLATLPWLALVMSWVAFILLATYLYHRYLDMDRVGGIWQLVYATVVAAVSVAFIAWCWAAFRGGYKKAILEKIQWIQQDAGVIVEEPAFRRGWWVLPLAYVMIIVWVFGVMRLSMRSAVRFQPLIFASGMTGLGIVISFMIDRRPKIGLRPVHFVWWGLYCCYALAAAAGLPQPWMDMQQPWGWSLRVGAPLLVLGPVDIVVRELHSRRQFRRLQQLLAEGPEETVAHGAD